MLFADNESSANIGSVLSVRDQIGNYCNGKFFLMLSSQSDKMIISADLE